MNRWTRFSLVLVTLMLTAVSTANAQYVEEIIEEADPYYEAPSRVVVTRVVRVRGDAGYYPGYYSGYGRPYGFRGGYRRGPRFERDVVARGLVNLVGAALGGYARGGYRGGRGGYGGFRGGYGGRR